MNHPPMLRSAPHIAAVHHASAAVSGEARAHAMLASTGFRRAAECCSGPRAVIAAPQVAPRPQPSPHTDHELR